MTDARPTAYMTEQICKRWALTERRAQWLVRCIPDRPMQNVVYERAPIGWRVVIDQRSEAAGSTVRY
jgi:hypothetical protein